MGMCELSWVVVQCSVLEKVLRLLRVDAVLQQSGAQIFKGKSVPLVLGALLRLGEHGAHLTVLQGVIGDVGDELLAGDGDQPQHARVVRRKAGAVHVMGRHRVGNGGLVVFEELQKVYQRLASGLLLLLLCWLRLLLMLLLLLLLAMVVLNSSNSEGTGKEVEEEEEEEEVAKRSIGVEVTECSSELCKKRSIGGAEELPPDPIAAADCPLPDGTSSTDMGVEKRSILSGREGGDNKIKESGKKR